MIREDYIKIYNLRMGVTCHKNYEVADDLKYELGKAIYDRSRKRRAKHTLILGKTFSGRTTLMEACILDIEADRVVKLDRKQGIRPYAEYQGLIKDTMKELIQAQIKARSALGYYPHLLLAIDDVHYRNYDFIEIYSMSRHYNIGTVTVMHSDVLRYMSRYRLEGKFQTILET